MADLVRDIVKKAMQKNKVAAGKIGDFRAGDTVGVYVRIREGDKDRVQLYKGVVLKIQGKDAGRSFTVRKISAGVGVERTFPYVSPAIDRVEVIARGQVRRSRLYFLRDLKGKAARLTSVLVGLKDEAPAEAKATADSAAAAE